MTFFEGSFLAPCGFRESEAVALPAKISWWDGQDTTKQKTFKLENCFLCPPTHFVLILKSSVVNCAEQEGFRQTEGRMEVPISGWKGLVTLGSTGGAKERL